MANSISFQKLTKQMQGYVCIFICLNMYMYVYTHTHPPKESNYSAAYFFHLKYACLSFHINICRSFPNDLTLFLTTMSYSVVQLYFHFFNQLHFSKCLGCLQFFAITELHTCLISVQTHPKNAVELLVRTEVYFMF